ncbi:BgTH12-01816 [Blumeria graminis f. sp. triticale]|uniref:BgTH12-01816 n=1 Tax=Blumeria graminis f. sp. triticale TaxID=1689686 RepID=A0A9W4CZ57_BLUGR|nr:BgTH12-01816 [Blumeria graminis f. sp. triticale]
MSFLDLSPSPEPSEADEDILFVLRAGDTKTSVLHNAPKNDVMNKVPNIPTHPIPSMQGAFAESFLESSAGYVAPTNEIHKSVATRRQILLSQSVTEPTHAARWRLKPGQQFHEFWKLMSQISFGIYLLLNGIARDEEQVMKILQVHVDEIDEFLETTLQDFNLAQDDIEERLKHLKLPLKNVAVFDSMMEDRVFRLQIVDGNEKIEHVISRTASAMNDALKDVQQGANACKEFTLYLAREQNNTLWKNRSNMRKVYEAMKGNVNGWYKAFVSLQTKGSILDVTLVQLGSILAEMDRRAGEVSRRTRFSTTSPQNSSMNLTKSLSRHESRISRQMRLSLTKGLYPRIDFNLPDIQLNLGNNQQATDGESDSNPNQMNSKEESIPEPDILLKPHTYTPVPSPNPASTSVFPENNKAQTNSPATVVPNMSSPPEVTRRSSVRKRFSISRRRNSYKKEGQREPVNHADWKSHHPVHLPATTFGTNEETTSNTQTSPKRDSDLAYYSDFEKTPHVYTPLATPDAPHDKHFSTNQKFFDSTHLSASSSNVNTVSFRNDRLLPVVKEGTDNRSFAEPAPLLTPVSIKIPEQQFFLPVNASPHSPLQRPWTAGPLQNPLHSQPNSSNSNLSTYTIHSRRNGAAHSTGRIHTHTPSTLRNLPSAMGQSTMSDATSKGPRKKRSMFGWLKEQFSLSEEEKQAFEARKQLGEIERLAAERMTKNSGPDRRRWLDGKRIDERGRMSETREAKRIQ